MSTISSNIHIGQQPPPTTGLDTPAQSMGGQLGVKKGWFSWESIKNLFVTLFRSRPPVAAFPTPAPCKLLVALNREGQVLAGGGETIKTMDLIPERMLRAIGQRNSGGLQHGVLLDENTFREIHDLRNLTSQAGAIWREHGEPVSKDLPDGWDNPLLEGSDYAGLLPPQLRKDFRVDNEQGLIVDKTTGLAASISFQWEKHEFCVAFNGSGAQEMNNLPNSLKALTGGIPGNFKHADQLVNILKSHLQESYPYYGLRLAGYCMGGGIASYLGVKHDLPFDTFNPMPLGVGLQRDLLNAVGGNTQILEDRAAKGRRFIMETDQVSDPAGARSIALTPRKKLNCQALGQGYLVPREYFPAEVKPGKVHEAPSKIFAEIKRLQDQ